MSSFVESFIQHVRDSGVQIPVISRRTGVSKDKLNALMNRRAKSTGVDDAMKIARFFGKSVEEFCGTPPDKKMVHLQALMSELSEGERELVEAQLKGLRDLRQKR